MNQDIPHADLIRAVLDGKTIQSRQHDKANWFEPDSSIGYMVYYPHWQYRIKPEFVTKAQALTTFLKITSGATWNQCDKEVVRRFIEEAP